MKLEIFGHDVEAQKNLEMVAQVARQEGHTVRATYRNANSRLPEDPSEVDAVLTGMASTEPQGDLAMGEWAGQHEKPWVVLADTWYGGTRNAARGRVRNATLLTASLEEMMEALKFGYRKLAFTGGPPKWQTIAAEPQVDVRREHGVSDDHRIILVSGGKNQVVVTQMLEEVAQAVRELLGDKFRIIFKPHPKEAEDCDDARRAAVLSTLQGHLIETPAPQVSLMDSADCVVSSPGGSATVEAVHRRRPNIWWENRKALERFIQMTGEESWPPLDSRATLRVSTYDPSQNPESISSFLTLYIREAIALALSPEGATRMRQMQEGCFPIVASQEIEKNILHLLADLVVAAKKPTGTR